jgi:hypothetical protein
LKKKVAMSAGSLRFDHAIIAVHDLDAAMRNYTSLGFTVFFGGKHANGATHNALIVLESSDYLELLAPTDPALLSSPDVSNPNSFLSFFANGEGLVGFALLSRNLTKDVEAMRSRGIAIDDPKPNSRVRPDGERLAWRAAMFGDSLVPFLIEDETPRVLRVSNAPRNIKQTNGVTGVAQLIVAVNDPLKSVIHYINVIGDLPHIPGIFMRDAKTADFELGKTSVTLAAPTGNSPLRAHLARRGESPYMLRLRTKDRKHLGLLDVAKTHGARIELVE